MELTRKQYEILVHLESTREEATQRELSQATNFSLGTVNRTVSQLTEKGYMENNRITDNGIAALEPYRVKRAIFIAAGFGSRLVPVTLNTPKPLVRVKGVRIIDTLLDAVLDAGIEDIVLVRGYLGEQFDQLLYKYPNIKFVDNPAYNEANNISSAMCVRHLYQNAYVFDADLILYNKKLISKYQYTTNYLGIHTDVTDDWCLQVKNGVITQMRVGGIDCYYMVGVSYWNEQDGAKMAEHIKRVYEMPGGKERFWDQVALECFAREYAIEVRPCTFDDIVEIDTYRDLQRLDHTYCLGSPRRLVLRSGPAHRKKLSKVYFESH